jgi:ABC-type nitrate/sulfonate/bicarbonate transport system permease component
LAYQADLMMAALLTLGGVAVLTDLAIVLVAQRVVHYAGK